MLIKSIVADHTGTCGNRFLRTNKQNSIYRYGGGGWEQNAFMCIPYTVRVNKYGFRRLNEDEKQILKTKNARFKRYYVRWSGLFGAPQTCLLIINAHSDLQTATHDCGYRR